jgi:predicted deacetylase
MKLLVSIHDVSPVHNGAVQRIWNHCVSVGVRPALLVVPNWHGAWPLREYRLFAEWLRDCEAGGSGADVFVHGERHDEVGATRELRDELRAFGRTEREAEFLTLRYSDARARIERGTRCLRACGVSPVGFVAPAWLTNAACDSALTDSGVMISETSTSVRLHHRGQRLSSPVIRWSARSEFRASVSCVAARAHWIINRKHWLVRIAIHPGDAQHPDTWSSVRSTIDEWLGVRHPWRYTML